MNIKSEHKSVLLKIFNGPHMGAEILLKPGEYVVGRCSSCDIALQDQLIDEQHAKITVVSNSVSVCPLENSEVLMKGKALTLLSENNVGLYQILKLGTTELAFGYPDGEWQKILRDSNYGVPKVGMLDIGGWSFGLAVQSIYIALENVINKYFPLKNGDDLKTIQSSYSTPLSSAVTNSDFNPGGEIVKDKISSHDVGQKPRRIKTIALAITALVLLTSCYKITSDMLSSTLDIKAGAVNSEVLHLLEQEKFKGVNVDKINEAETLLTGFVATAEDLQELDDHFSDIPLNITDNVRVGWSLANAADKVLEVIGFPDLEVNYLPHGRIGVTGYVVKSPLWTEAKHTLMQDISGLKAIDETGLQYFDDRKKILLKALEDADLQNKIKVVNGGDNQIVVMGLLDSQEMNKWKNIAAQFSRDFGDKPSIQSRVGDTREMLDFEIRAVRVGSNPYLVAADGSRYLAGGLLPNGFKIKQIFSDKVIFSKYGMDAVYSLVD